MSNNNKTEENPISPPDSSPPFWSPVIDFMAEQAIIVIAIVFALLWQKLLRPRLDQARSGFKRSWQQSQAIRDSLAKLQILYAADRVVLAEFTNGNKGSQTEIHYWKLRILQEVVKDGVSKVSFLLGKRSIDISEIPEEINKLIEEEIYILECSQTLPTGCYRHLRKIGVECIVQILLKNKDKEPIGILSIQFTNINYRVRDIHNLLKRDKRSFEIVAAVSSALTPDPVIRLLFDEIFNRN